MKYKNLFILISLSALLVACNDKDELKNEASDKETDEAVQTILEDNSVIDSEITEKENEVQVKVEVNGDFNEADAEKFTKQYQEELEKIYNNKNIHIQIIKEDKTIFSTNMEKEVPQDNNQETTEGLKVKELVELEIIEFKINPVSKQISVLAHENKLKEYVNKEFNEISLLVEEQQFKFETNQFKESLLQVQNTNFTEEQLLLANIDLK